MTVVARKASSKVRFTIIHAFAASLALHGLIVAPFALQWSAPPEDDDEVLVLDLTGMETDEQIDEKLKERTQGIPGSDSASRQEKKTAEASESSPVDAAQGNASPKMAGAASSQPAASASAAAGSPGPLDAKGIEQEQESRRIARRVEIQIDPLQAYAKALTKKVQLKLVYPEAGRRAGWRGSPVVAFTILADGAIAEGSLKIVTSSGQSKLDESALRTIRACAPFAPPPRVIELKISVTYGR